MSCTRFKKKRAEGAPGDKIEKWPRLLIYPKVPEYDVLKLIFEIASAGAPATVLYYKVWRAFRASHLKSAYQARQTRYFNPVFLDL